MKKKSNKASKTPSFNHKLLTDNGTGESLRDETDSSIDPSGTTSNNNNSAGLNKAKTVFLWVFTALLVPVVLALIGIVYTYVANVSRLEGFFTSEIKSVRELMDVHNDAINEKIDKYEQNTDKRLEKLEEKPN